MTADCPAPPAAADELFGDALPAAVAYAEMLVSAGVERGLLGPREAPRIWDRHLLNCAVIAPLVPPGAVVVDVGSGAGLPGLVLALMRPDLRITLVEPLLRRTVFLEECVHRLGLSTVEVRRARAEDLAGSLGADVVTARAVAPLARLAGWCLPLVRPGGSLLALKGSTAEVELIEAGTVLGRLGATDWSVSSAGQGIVDPPTTVVTVVAGPRRRSGRPAPRQRRAT